MLIAFPGCSLLFLWSLRPWEIDYSQGGQPDPSGSAWVCRVGRAGEDPEPTWSRRGQGLLRSQQDSEEGGGECLEMRQRDSACQGGARSWGWSQGPRVLDTLCVPSPLLEAGDSSWGC